MVQTVAQSSNSEDDARARLRLWLRLLKTSRRIEAEIRENLRVEFGTTLPRFDVMAALSRSDKGLKMSELSGVLRVSNGNVTGIVDRLVSDGFIERVPVLGDRRASLVQLTDKGRAEFDKQAQAHAIWIDHLLGDFTGPEAQDICTRFDKVNQYLHGTGDSQ